MQMNNFQLVLQLIYISYIVDLAIFVHRLNFIVLFSCFSSWFPSQPECGPVRHRQQAEVTTASGSSQRKWEAR